MKSRGSFEQCFNAQAGVEVDSMLVVGQHVCNAPNDKQQLEPKLNMKIQSNTNSHGHGRSIGEQLPLGCQFCHIRPEV